MNQIALTFKSGGISGGSFVIHIQESRLVPMAYSTDMIPVTQSFFHTCLQISTNKLISNGLSAVACYIHCIITPEEMLPLTVAGSSGTQ
jgi:hypothetical protein